MTSTLGAPTSRELGARLDHHGSLPLVVRAARDIANFYDAESVRGDCGLPVLFTHGDCHLSYLDPRAARRQESPKMIRARLGHLALTSCLSLVACAKSAGPPADALAPSKGSPSFDTQFASPAPGPSPATPSPRAAASEPPRPEPPATVTGYDAAGHLAGRKDPNGQFYNAAGQLTGRVDSNGQYYDHTGALAGRTDGDGHFYRASGVPLGRLDSTGLMYDGQGRLAGRIDPNGFIYDGQGTPLGRVDGLCNERCKEDAARAVLERR